MISNQKKILLSFFVLVAAIFIMLRLPALSFSYHQDEYKWAYLVNNQVNKPGGIPHPPLGEFVYSTAGKLAGFDNLRVVPFIFGFANLFLLYYLAKMLFGKKGAVFSALFFAVSFYSVLASLMIDTDGQIMPFFFLLASTFYFKWMNEPPGRNKKIFLGLFFGACIGGFMVKLSFVAAIAAFALDFFIAEGLFNDKKKIASYLLKLFSAAAGLIVILFLAKFIFPFFDLVKGFSYWAHFVNFFHRNYLQTFIQFVKAILYCSPLLVVPLFYLNKDLFVKARLFVLFILSGMFFYLVLFDFSTGALDRYFQYLIVPLCIISGAVLADGIRYLSSRETAGMIAISSVIFGVQFLPHFTSPLYPKSDWFNLFASLKWNFLFPFTGGSGPAGFYVSWLFIAISWIISLFLALLGRFNHKYFISALAAVFVIGMAYNGVFIEEHEFGKINGSPYVLLHGALEHISNNRAVKSVITYNDIGAYELQGIKKYERRMYAAPQFEKTYLDVFRNYTGHYLVIDIPKISENSIYSKYLSSCQNIYERKDKQITARLFFCKNLK